MDLLGAVVGAPHGEVFVTWELSKLCALSPESVLLIIECGVGSSILSLKSMHFLRLIICAPFFFSSGLDVVASVGSGNLCLKSVNFLWL